MISLKQKSLKLDFDILKKLEQVLGAIEQVFYHFLVKEMITFERERQTDRQTDTKSVLERESERERERESQTDRLKECFRERQTETDRQTHTKSVLEREINHFNKI